MSHLTPYSPPPCPWLPSHRFNESTSLLTLRENAKNSLRDGSFYAHCLKAAQIYWLKRRPAQAILLINKAWTACLTEDEQHERSSQPFQALNWILHQAGEGQAGFIGNPVRHFQHLASRVSGPQAPARSWRAWACFHLAERQLKSGRHPRDGRQIIREGLWIPSLNRTIHEVKVHGWFSDAADLNAALKGPRGSIGR